MTTQVTTAAAPGQQTTALLPTTPVGNNISTKTLDEAASPAKSTDSLKTHSTDSPKFTFDPLPPTSVPLTATTRTSDLLGPPANANPTIATFATDLGHAAGPSNDTTESNKFITISGDKASPVVGPEFPPLATQSPKTTVLTASTLEPTALEINRINSSVIVAMGHSLTVGAQAQTISGEVMSADEAGLVIGTGSFQSTIPVTMQNKISSGPDHADLVTIGSITTTITFQSVQSADNMTTAAPGASFNNTASEAGIISTIKGTGFVSLEPQVMTRTTRSGGVQVLANTRTTITLSPGGPAATLGSARLSAATDGLQVAHMNSTTKHKANKVSSAPITHSALASSQSILPQTTTVDIKILPTTTTARISDGGRNSVNSVLRPIMLIGLLVIFA
jgi:hypothetical protein